MNTLERVVLLLALLAVGYGAVLHVTGHHAEAVDFAKLALVDLTVLSLLVWFAGPAEDLDED